MMSVHSRYGLVYLVTNKVNGKMYVGQTTLPSAQLRFQGHVKSASEGKSLLGKAIMKYGPEVFTIRQVGEAYTRENLDFLEIDMISSLDTLAPRGYNLLSGGFSGGKHHPDTIKKIADATRASLADPDVRRARNQAVRQSLSSVSMRKKLSSSIKEALSKPEIRKKISEASVKTMNNPERKRHQSEAVSKAWLDPEKKARLKASIREAQNRPGVKSKLSEKLSEKIIFRGIETTLTKIYNDNPKADSLSLSHFKTRFRRGMSIEDALTKSLRKR